jgi:hypothetical protein
MLGEDRQSLMTRFLSNFVFCCSMMHFWALIIRINEPLIMFNINATVEITWSAVSWSD